MNEYQKIMAKAKDEENEMSKRWHGRLKELGVIAAVCPNTCHLDYADNKVKMDNPIIIIRKPKVGDTIAVGWYWKNRLVKIKSFSKDDGIEWVHFERTNQRRELIPQEAKDNAPAHVARWM